MAGEQEGPAGMDRNPYVRFNPRALHVLELAYVQARQLNHHRLGEDDLLCGLALERDGVAAQALNSLGVDLGDLGEHLRQYRGAAGTPLTGPIYFTGGVMKALGLAHQEAVYPGHPYIGTEHLLLGLLRGEGPAARILAQHHVSLPRASWRVQELLDQYQYGRRQAG